MDDTTKVPVKEASNAKFVVLQIEIIIIIIIIYHTVRGLSLFY